ncbi:MAG: ATP-binding cassette domain-containing protein, partial [Acetatifactor sp.]|nr:ATP-binding cassette domain-containing protein [Acetatifactor sp.]
MGNSGSGKSTLLYALSGMDKPTLGSVRYKDEEITNYSNDRLAVFRRENCGFVFQQNYLNDTMSVLDNIMVSGLFKLQGALDVQRMGGNAVLILGLAVVNVVIGILMVINPFESAMLLYRLLGAGLLFSGLTDMASTLYLSSKMHGYMKKMSEADEAIKVTEIQSEGTSGEADKEVSTPVTETVPENQPEQNSQEPPVV